MLHPYRGGRARRLPAGNEGRGGSSSLGQNGGDRHGRSGFRPQQSQGRHECRCHVAGVGLHVRSGRELLQLSDASTRDGRPGRVPPYRRRACDAVQRGLGPGRDDRPLGDRSPVHRRSHRHDQRRGRNRRRGDRRHAGSGHGRADRRQDLPREGGGDGLGRLADLHAREPVGNRGLSVRDAGRDGGTGAELLRDEPGNLAAARRRAQCGVPRCLAASVRGPLRRFRLQRGGGPPPGVGQGALVQVLVRLDRLLAVAQERVRAVRQHRLQPGRLRAARLDRRHARSGGRALQRRLERRLSVAERRPAEPLGPRNRLALVGVVLALHSGKGNRRFSDRQRLLPARSAGAARVRRRGGAAGGSDRERRLASLGRARSARRRLGYGLLSQELAARQPHVPEDGRKPDGPDLLGVDNVRRAPQEEMGRFGYRRGAVRRRRHEAPCGGRRDGPVQRGLLRHAASAGGQLPLQVLALVAYGGPLRVSRVRGGRAAVDKGRGDRALAQGGRGDDADPGRQHRAGRRHGLLHVRGAHGPGCPLAGVGRGHVLQGVAGELRRLRRAGRPEDTGAVDPRGIRCRGGSETRLPHAVQREPGRRQRLERVHHRGLARCGHVLRGRRGPGHEHGPLRHRPVPGLRFAFPQTLARASDSGHGREPRLLLLGLTVAGSAADVPVQSRSDQHRERLGSDDGRGRQGGDRR